MVCELVRLETNYSPPPLNWRTGAENTVKVWKYELNKKLKGSWKLSLLRGGVCKALFFVYHCDIFKNQQEERENNMSSYFRRLVKLTGKFLCRQRTDIYCPCIISSAHSKTQRALAQISINKSSHNASDLSPKFRSVLEATMSIKIISSSCC